jgi:hypothetical protein
MSWLNEHWADIVAMPPIRTRRAGCAVTRCDRPSQALGLCSAHYNAARQQYDPGFRASYLAAKRERGRANRRGEAGVAGQREHPTPDVGRGLPRPPGRAPGTGAGRAS